MRKKIYIFLICVASTFNIFIINICCGGDMENAKGNTKREQKSQESLNSPTEVWYAFWDAMIRRDAKTAYDLLVVIKEEPFSYISYKEFSNLLNTVTEKDIERWRNERGEVIKVEIKEGLPSPQPYIKKYCDNKWAILTVRELDGKNEHSGVLWFKNGKWKVYLGD